MKKVLFQPDNFTPTEIRFVPVDPRLPLLSAMLSTHFPGWEILEASQLDRKEINSANYKVLVYSPEEVTQKVLVREYKVLQDEAQISLYLDFLTQLNDRRVLVSKVHKAIDGALVSRQDGLTYSVFEYLDGTHFVPTEAGYASVAYEVACMHTAFAQLDQKYVDRIEEYSRYGDTFFNGVPQVCATDFAPIKRAIEQKSKRTEIDAHIYELLPMYEDAAKEIEAMRVREEARPKEIFHSDLHPHNILMAKDTQRAKAIVDFDSVRVQPLGRALDVAYAMFRLGRQFFVGQNLTPEQMSQRARTLRELFVSRYSETRQLPDDEVRLLKFLCTEEMMKKLIFLLRGTYLGDKSQWSHELPKFVVALEEIDMFWSG